MKDKPDFPQVLHRLAAGSAKEGIENTNMWNAGELLAAGWSEEEVSNQQKKLFKVMHKTFVDLVPVFLRSFWYMRCTVPFVVSDYHK